MPESWRFPDMATIGNLLQYVLLVLAVSIAAILLCLYHYSKKKRGSYDVTPLPESGTEMVVFFNRVPPGYSTADPPPPYSLVDPKLTVVWPDSAPPPYELHPITIPMAPCLWTSDSCRTSHWHNTSLSFVTVNKKTSFFFIYNMVLIKKSLHQWQWSNLNTYEHQTTV